MCFDEECDCIAAGYIDSPLVLKIAYTAGRCTTGRKFFNRFIDIVTCESIGVIAADSTINSDICIRIILERPDQTGKGRSRIRLGPISFVLIDGFITCHDMICVLDTWKQAGIFIVDVVLPAAVMTAGS